MQIAPIRLQSHNFVTLHTLFRLRTVCITDNLSTACRPSMFSSNAALLCTGLLGANFAQILLNLVRFDDPITRGLSTSSAAHGLGTAAMAGS